MKCVKSTACGDVRLLNIEVIMCLRRLFKICITTSSRDGQVIYARPPEVVNRFVILYFSANYKCREQFFVTPIVNQV